MKFFDNLFDLEYSNNYSISGLNVELDCIYIYNTFIKNKDSILVVVNTLYEANNFYQRLLNYTENVLFFSMVYFINS